MSGIVGYKILLDKDNFPKELWFNTSKGGTIELKHNSQSTDPNEFFFLLDKDGTETQSRGTYKKSGVDSNHYYEYKPTSSECNYDLTGGFFLKFEVPYKIS